MEQFTTRTYICHNESAIHRDIVRSFIVTSDISSKEVRPLYSLPALSKTLMCWKTKILIIKASRDIWVSDINSEVWGDLIRSDMRTWIASPIWLIWWTQFSRVRVERYLFRIRNITDGIQRNCFPWCWCWCMAKKDKKKTAAHKERVAQKVSNWNGCSYLTYC